MNNQDNISTVKEAMRHIHGGEFPMEEKDVVDALDRWCDAIESYQASSGVTLFEQQTPITPHIEALKNCYEIEEVRQFFFNEFQSLAEKLEITINIPFYSSEVAPLFFYTLAEVCRRGGREQFIREVLLSSTQENQGNTAEFKAA